MTIHKIHFMPFGKTTELVKGKTILEYAQELAIPLLSSCGGKGKCGQCRVIIYKGVELLNSRTNIEEKFLGNVKQRLACQTKTIDITHDVYIEVMPYSELQILVKGIDKKIELSPLTKMVGNKIVFGEQVVGDYEGKIYGLAADIGTTTVVLHLINLETGECIFTTAFENPQKKIAGDNVIKRIGYDKEKPGELQKLLISYINKEIKKYAKNVYEMVVVGNTTMRDLFFGIDVQTIGVTPYKSITELKRGPTYIYKKAREIFLDIYPQANIYGASIIGSHIGADATAVCLTTGLFDTSEETSMAIDIGTNSEIILKHKDILLATSCAAGSALEPMPAVEGAIERIKLEGDKVTYKTVRGLEPVGICGSGIIDLLAEMLTHGVMDEKGYLTVGKVFNITDSIAITQQQIKGQEGLIWSKAAISLGIKVLLEHAGITITELKKVYLAGSFGNFIDKANARKIGLVPAVPLERIMQVGNAAVEGAKQMLLSKKRRELAEKAARKVKVVNLESIPNYGERLILEEQYFRELTT